MPRNGSGVYNLPGVYNPVVSGTTISTTAFNTTMTDIATAVTGSLPTNGEAGMTGPLRLASGSASSPPLGFNSEPSTGLYWPGTGVLGFTLSGGEKARLLSNGNLIIGSTTDTGHKLQVNGTSNLVGDLTIGGVINGDVQITKAATALNIRGTSNSATASSGSNLILERGRGTFGTPISVLTGDTLGSVAFSGYGTSYVPTAGITAFASQNYSGTAAGSVLAFSTTSDNSVTATERLRITQTGDLNLQSGGSSINNVAAVNGGPLAGFRNRVINGQMRVDQRNGGAPVTPSSTALFVTDRWQAGVSQASRLTYQGSVDAPAGFFRSLKISTISAFSPGASDGFQLLQTIEADNLTDFQFGLATAQTVSLSFWVKGTVAGTYSLSICNPTGARTFVATYAVTTGWTQVKIVVPGDTAGSWPTGGPTAGAVLRFCMGAGTALATATTNAWVAGNFLKATGTLDLVANASASLNVTGVQLELGSTATQFEQVGIGQELINCQRYFQRSLSAASCTIWNGDTSNGSNYTTRRPFSVPMRVAPTMVGTVESQSGFPAGILVMGADAVGMFENRTASSTTIAAYYSSNWTATAEL